MLHVHCIAWEGRKRGNAQNPVEISSKDWGKFIAMLICAAIVYELRNGRACACTCAGLSSVENAVAKHVTADIIENHHKNMVRSVGHWGWWIPLSSQMFARWRWRQPGRAEHDAWPGLWCSAEIIWGVLQSLRSPVVTMGFNKLYKSWSSMTTGWFGGSPNLGTMHIDPDPVGFVSRIYIAYTSTSRLQEV